MLCVVIKGPSIGEAFRQIQESLEFADLVELRIDLLDSLEGLYSLRNAFSVPMIFKVSTVDQFKKILPLNPDYIDIDHHLGIDEEKFPHLKLILSHHDFEKTPDLDEIYREMKKKKGRFYKIACMATSTIDALRMLKFIKETKIVGISMGELGQSSRILGKIVGAPIVYAALNENLITAPGQLTAKTLIETYYFKSMNSSTAIYGLIGDPVEQSISHDTHNRHFFEKGYNAVYVKMLIKAEELNLFFQYSFLFKGLSVTMPLKEKVIPFLDEICTPIGAVNTLDFFEGKIRGYNTDGMGALDAIETYFQVSDKKIALIGAGGTAKAIAFEVQRRGGKIQVRNRDKKRGLQLGEPWNIEDQIDIVINCTPNPLPLDPKLIKCDYVMDINIKETEFIKSSKENGFKVISGVEMFLAQASYQFKLWFKSFL